MSVIVELEKQYIYIDNEFARKEFEAKRRRWTKKEAEYRRKREINDQAYFLFMFSRLEDRITQEAEKRIRKKKSSKASWREKAPWENMPNDVKDMHFKNRLSLLSERGNTNFNRVMEYYKERNSIAHGGGFISMISMPVVTAEFIRLYNCMQA
jgi:hypothetical protein